MYSSTEKSVILTSDMDSRRMQGIEGRIYSRFVRGIVAGIDEPDVKVKMGMLDQRLDAFGVRIPSSVKELIVTNASNAFEIEGMTNKMNIFLKAYDSTHEITKEIAKRILDIEDKTD